MAQNSVNKEVNYYVFVMMMMKIVLGTLGIWKILKWRTVLRDPLQLDSPAPRIPLAEYSEGV